MFLRLCLSYFYGPFYRHVTICSEQRFELRVVHRCMQAHCLRRKSVIPVKGLRAWVLSVRNKLCRRLFGQHPQFCIHHCIMRWVSSSPIHVFFFSACSTSLANVLGEMSVGASCIFLNFVLYYSTASCILSSVPL